MTILIVILVLNVALWPIFRWIGKRSVKQAKLQRLEVTAREWQQTGYLVPMSFCWRGSNPVLLWQRMSDGKTFPLEIE